MIGAPILSQSIVPFSQEIRWKGAICGFWCHQDPPVYTAIPFTLCTMRSLQLYRGKAFATSPWDFAYSFLTLLSQQQQCALLSFRFFKFAGAFIMWQACHKQPVIGTLKSLKHTVHRLYLSGSPTTACRWQIVKSQAFNLQFMHMPARMTLLQYMRSVLSLNCLESERHSICDSFQAWSSWSWSINCQLLLCSAFVNRHPILASLASAPSLGISRWNLCVYKLHRVSLSIRHWRCKRLSWRVQSKMSDHI